MRNNFTCSTNCKYRTAETLFTLETRSVSGVNVNNLHKGYNKYNNNNNNNNNNNKVSWLWRFLIAVTAVAQAQS